VVLRGAGAGDRDTRALVAPPDTTLNALIGPHTRAALLGPARLEVVGVSGDATTVRLESGSLYASFDGGAGRSLRVEAPDLGIDVVGRLFAVEVRARRAGGTCVSVAHGRVRVRAGVTARARYVGAGERTCTGERRAPPALVPAMPPAPSAGPPAIEPIEPRVRDALMSLESITASADRGAPSDGT